MKQVAVFGIIVVFLGGLVACQPSSSGAIPPTALSATAQPAMPAQPAPQPTNTLAPALHSPNGPPLSLLRMFSETDGWGLIYNQLLLTHNGGTTWFSVPIPNGQINESSRLFFVTDKNLYLTSPGPDGQPWLYHSTDGGGTWQSAPAPFANGQLLFIHETGYFLETTPTSPNSMKIAIFTSGDGGLSWNRIFPETNSQPGNNIPEDGIKTGFSFITAERGWLGLAGQKQGAALYISTNGGANWQKQEIPLPQNITAMQTTILPPVFFDGDEFNGLLPVDFIPAGGGEQQRVFYHTEDGGNTWAPGEPVAEGDAFAFLDGNTGWVWGRRGLLFTNDGAKTWQVLPVAFGRSEHATNISFINPKTGWLITTDAKKRVRMYQTNDAGSTWMAINP